MLPSRFTNLLAGILASQACALSRRRITWQPSSVRRLYGADQLSPRLVHFLAALETLPERPRRIYLAHSRDDLAYPVIALQMGMTIKEVEQELALALSLLADALDGK